MGDPSLALLRGQFKPLRLDPVEAVADLLSTIARGTNASDLLRHPPHPVEHALIVLPHFGPSTRACWDLDPADMNGRNGKLFNSSRVRFVSDLAYVTIVDRKGQQP
jgi:hypothetical protein